MNTLYYNVGDSRPGRLPPSGAAAGIVSPVVSTAAVSVRPAGVPATSPSAAGGELERQLHLAVEQMGEAIQRAPRNGKVLPSLIAMRDALSVAVGEVNVGSAPEAAAERSTRKTLEQLLVNYHPSAPAPVDSVEWTKYLLDAFIFVCRLQANQLGLDWQQKAVTRALLECQTDHRFNVDAIHRLVGFGLVHLPTYDRHLSDALDSGTNLAAQTFVPRLLQKLFVDEPSRNVGQQEFEKTILSLSQMNLHGRSTQPVEGG